MEVNKVVIWDIETLKEMFLVMIYDPQEDEWLRFGLWKDHDSLDKMYKYFEYLRRNEYYMVGFNSLAFDSQVVEYVLRGLKDWHTKLPTEVIDLIYRKSQNVINDNNHGLFPPYREHELFVPQIDPFRIAHYDNDAKRTSLTA